MLTVRQSFPPTPPVDVSAAVIAGFPRLGRAVKPGQHIAIAVGSRGISGIAEIVRTLIGLLREAGARPFIVPAMGSHAGATAEGQEEILGTYGISEKALGVPVRAGMEVRKLGRTRGGVDVFLSREALRADGIIIVNRIKPHTDFRGRLGSGVMKMMVVGLGKRIGATQFHIGASRLGYEPVLRAMARVILERAPILGGVAIVENHFHQTARLEILPASGLERQEEKLFQEASRLMPRLPFDEIDLLIVDQLGKNISGSGLDPNITGRWVHGYSSMLNEKGRQPNVRRLFVRGLTPETKGNGIGIGLADFTTSRLVRELEVEIMAINALTSMTPNSVKIPIHFETDREVLERALGSMALADPRTARIVRIRDTLSLDTLEVSEPLNGDLRKNKNLSVLRKAAPMKFDPRGNLGPLGK